MLPGMWLGWSQGSDLSAEVDSAPGWRSHRQFDPQTALNAVWAVKCNYRQGRRMVIALLQFM
jgi:hypothetical protein